MNWYGRSTFIVLLVLGFHALSRFAHADDRPRIVIVGDRDQPELAKVIAAELRTMGFAASVVFEPTGEHALENLETVTEREGALAGIELISTEASLKVWVHDRTTGKTLVREIRRPTHVEESTLAIRAVELLRASLLELSLVDGPRGDLEATPALLDAARVPEIAPAAVARPAKDSGLKSQAPPANSKSQRLAKLGLDLGPAVVASAGGLPPFAALSIGAGFFFSRPLRAGAFVMVPLTAMSNDAVEGHSDTRITIAGLESRFELGSAALRPSFGAGCAAAILTATGRAGSPAYTDQSDTRTSVGPNANAGITFQPRRELALRVGVVSGLQTRPFAIAYAGREVARWGSPWVAGWLLLESRFFE